MKRRLVAYICLLVLPLLLLACSNKNGFDAGTPMTPEELARLRDALSAGEITNDTEVSGTVYWIPGGSVYHVSESCHYIAEKANVMSGTVEDAAMSGKTAACSYCAAD